MRCNRCQGNTKVTETIEYHDDVYRRRKCLECGMNFCTKETPVPIKDTECVKALRLKREQASITRARWKERNPDYYKNYYKKNYSKEQTDE